MNLAELIDRVERAERGSLQLDVDVLEVVWPRWITESEELARFVTSSVDSALGLVERVLPGWEYCISKGLNEPACASISPANRVTDACGEATTPALALVAATLRALQEQSDGR